MKLNSIELNNFRRFENLKLDFSSEFNLLVGDNGAGKTTILDGIAVAIGCWFLGIPEIYSRHIWEFDARTVMIDRVSEQYEEAKYPVRVSAIGDVEGHGEVQWSRTRNSSKGRTTYSDAQRIKNIALRAYQRSKENGSYPLPLIVYYGTSRIWDEPRDMGRIKRPSRIDGYLGAIDPRIRTAKFIRWMKKQAYADIQDGQSFAYHAVCNTIKNCFVDDVKVEYHIRRDRLEISTGEQVLSFDQLSAGQRGVVSLVGDIAVRTVTLNPQYDKEAPTKTTGIVLIDEIDLHLHPKWQRIFVEALATSFPKVQFIATTHSPFIIQGMRKGKVINLDKPDNIEREPTYNRSIEEIVEFVQGVDEPRRSERHKQLSEVAFDYLQKIDKAKFSSNPIEFIAELDGMIGRFGDDPGTAALLKFKRAASKIDEKL